MSKDQEMIMHGPVELKISVMVVSEKTNQISYADMGMGIFKYPTPEEVQARIKHFEEKELPEGYRLLNKEEAWKFSCEAHGVELSEVPNGLEWDAIQ